MTISRRPHLEELETRLAPATWGNPWPDGTNLTLSFAPDGTQVGPATNALFETLDGTGDTSEWQLEVLRAFQTWAVRANINIGLVSDGGQDFGTSGRPQGDARFGDIRLGAYAMSEEVLAIASPFETGAGTWSGDVKLNSQYAFGIDAEAGEIDLRTVLIHEAAHVFGIDTIDDVDAATFASYQGIRHDLSDIDVSAIEALYGARQHDSYEGSRGNETLGTATHLGWLTNSTASLRLAATGDITTSDDVDVYKFRTGLGLTNTTITLETEGVSLLAGQITVYDRYGRVVDTETATDPLSGNLTIEIGRVRSFSDYYVKIEGNGDELFGVGSYNLEIETNAILSGLLGGLLEQTVPQVLDLINDDLHTNDTFLTADLGLLAPLAQTDSRFDFAYKASIGSLLGFTDVDIYRIQAPAVPEDGSVLTIMAWGLENDGLIPKATVYNAQRQVVTSQVLVNADGVSTIQVENVQAGANYYVKLEAADPNGDHATGNYFVGIDFSTQAVALRELTNGSLTEADSHDSRALVVNRSSLLHFVVETEATGVTNGLVTVTIEDSEGNVVKSVQTAAGQPMSFGGHFAPGRYKVTIQGEGSWGSDGVITYKIKGQRQTDPIGPRPESTSSTPEQQQYNYGSTSETSSQREPTPSNGTTSEPDAYPPPPQKDTAKKAPPSSNDSYDSSDPYGNGDSYDEFYMTEEEEETTYTNPPPSQKPSSQEPSSQESGSIQPETSYSYSYRMR